MHPSLQDLHQLQQIDTRISQLKRAQATLDDGSSVKKELESYRAQYQAASTALRSLRSESQDAELKLKTIETKKKNYESKLHSGQVGSSKELVSLENEIGLLASTKDQLEDRILTLMDEIEAKTPEIKTLQKKVEALESQLTEAQAAYKEKFAKLNEQIAQTVSQRAPLASKIDPIVLKRYESLARNNGIGLAEVIEGGCSACHTSLTPFALREVRESTTLVTCENCNRILYPPEE